MKSFNEILNDLRARLQRSQRQRSSFKSRGFSKTGEAAEARVLLSANSIFFNELVTQEIAADEAIPSYFAKFSSAKSASLLATETGAISVTTSTLIPNGYDFEFSDGKTLLEASEIFTGMTDIEYLHPNVARQYSTRAIPNDPLFTDQWHLQNTGQSGGLVGADANITTAWDTVTGQGVTIAIIDDGLQTNHEDLAANVNTTIDFDFNFNDDDPSPNTNAFFGDFHGTAVAGVAAGVGNNALGAAGAAYNAELVGLRLIAGPVSDAVQAAALSHQSGIIDIYNNSWGPVDNGRISSIGPRALAALERAATTGRGGLGNIHTWAGGNGGDITNDNVNYDPYANSRFTIAVGAINNFGVRSSYSDVGAPLVVVAPSNDVGPNANPSALGITTTDLTGAPGYSTTNYANDFGGTSSATPLVSGVIALMLEANPDLSYRDVTDILARTSERVDPNNADWVQNGAGLWVNHEYGFGGIDATAAVNLSRTHVPLGPELTFATGSQTVNQPIPEGGVAVSQTVTVDSADAIDSLEYVEIVFSAAHTSIGDLEVVLTSPDGTQSVLAETRAQDTTNGYTNFVFSSVRHWGESSAGDWTLSVSDNGNAGTGTFTSFELRFFGTGAVALAPIIVQSNGTSAVSDSGQTDSFTVVLPEQPTSNVVVNVSNPDVSEVTVSPQTLTFTPANWNTPQTVSLSGVFDLVGDGDQVTNLTVAVNTALSDAAYGQATPEIVAVTSFDDDQFIPGKPVVTSPIGLVDTTSPTFSWTVVDNALDYNLVVRNVFSNAIVRQTTVRATTSTTISPPFQDGVYSVTVQGVNTQGQQGPLSDPVIFGIGEPQLPGVPVITSPVLGSTVTDPRAPIVWNAVAGAIQYELYIRTQDGVTRPLEVGTDLNNGSLQYITPTDFPEGDVSVWIRSLDPFGGMSDWSAPVRFTVNAVELPTTPIITSPLVDVTTNPFPRFSWVGDGDTYELWVAQRREGTGTQQVPAIYDRVIYLREHRGLSYTHFNPLANSDYRVWVRAANSAGEKSTWSQVEEFTVAVPTPATPDLSVSLTSNSLRPRFSWQTSGDAYVPGTTFDLWVNNLSTGQSRVIRNTALTGSSYTPDFDLSQGRYRAWIRSTTALGVNSPWSSPVTFEIDLASPERPTVTGPIVTDTTSGTSILTDLPTITWTPSPGAVRYELWVNHVDSGTSRIIHETELTETSFTATTPLPQGQIRVWVRAFNEAGEAGEWSRPFTFTIDIPTPTTPVITAPTANAVGTVSDATPTIVWTSSGESVITYDLQLENTITAASVLNLRNIESAQYTVLSPLAETTYRVRVRGVNSADETSDWSPWFTFTIDVPNATTPIPVSPVGTVTTSTVTFEWQHTPGNVRYEILVRDLLRQESIVIQVSTSELNLGADTAVFTRDGFADGTYRWWVRAFNSENTASSWSVSRSFNVDAQVNLEPESLLQETGDILQVSVRKVIPSAERSVNREEVAAVESHRNLRSSVPVQTRQNNGESLNADLFASEFATVMAELADPAVPMPFADQQRQS